ncbi:MAG: AtpZ/AtpI family protein [Chloroflexi bacterium]|nr:AtpZ/AtpI family protein [Chloroflexota bacterium]
MNTLLVVMIGQVGCLTLVVILASVFLGLWLDDMFGTKPILTLVLLFAGIPLSVILMLFVSRRTLARLKEQNESKEKDMQEADFGTTKT